MDNMDNMDNMDKDAASAWRRLARARAISAALE